MNSSRPYIVNALIDWIIDNGCTPHIVLDVSCEDVNAPSEFARDNKLVLNVSGTAVRNFKLDSGGLELDARFNGEPQHVTSPVGAIIGIYARENGEGMAFELAKSERKVEADDKAVEADATELPSHLRLVKE